jgi:hypothetical protein
MVLKVVILFIYAKRFTMASLVQTIFFSCLFISRFGSSSNSLNMLPCGVFYCDIAPYELTLELLISSLLTGEELHNPADDLLILFFALGKANVAVE